MRRLVGSLVPLAILTLAGPSFALDQKDHYERALSGCTAAGLPADFCDRAAVEAYNVDRYEFWDLVSHAQIEGPEAVCSTATKVVDRAAELGAGVRTALQARDKHAAASNLGRALHLVHDNCAHHGVGNPEHAWYSLQDVCEGTSNSPDKDPAAGPCAQEDTTVVMSAFLDALNSSGMSKADLAGVDSLSKKKAVWNDKCAFLADAETWDGRNIAWDRNLVRPMIQQGLVDGLDGVYSSHDVCGGDPTTIAQSAPKADVDISGGTPSCWKVHLYCLGKADDPFEPDGTSSEVQNTSASGDSSGGCQLGASTPSASGSLILLGAASILLAKRRRGVR